MWTSFPSPYIFLVLAIIPIFSLGFFHRISSIKKHSHNYKFSLDAKKNWEPIKDLNEQANQKAFAFTLPLSKNPGTNTFIKICNIL